MTKTITVTTAGTLSSLLTPIEKTSITKLVVVGNIDARDFKCLRDELLVLADLDLSAVSIKAYTGTGGTFYWSDSYQYLANEIPMHCFVRLNMTGYQDNRRLESVLTKIVFPNTLTYIGDNAFTNHSGLMSITIPDSVKKLGLASFEKCSKLEYLSIGAGVTELGNQAFMDCANLKTIIMKPVTPPIAYELTFRNAYKHTSTVNCPIVYVPNSCVEAYNKAEGFGYYRSYTHPQTGNFVVGITGISNYSGTIPQPPPVAEPPVIVTPPTPPTPPVKPPVAPNVYDIKIDYSRYYGRIEKGGKKLYSKVYSYPNASNEFTITPNAGYKIDEAYFDAHNIKAEIVNGKYTAVLTPDVISVLSVRFKKQRTIWNRTQMTALLTKFNSDSGANMQEVDLTNWLQANL